MLCFEEIPMVSFKMSAPGDKHGPRGDENRIAESLPAASPQEDEASDKLQMHF